MESSHRHLLDEDEEVLTGRAGIGQCGSKIFKHFECLDLSPGGVIVENCV
jgi:hypothetical protein